MVVVLSRARRPTRPTPDHFAVHADDRWLHAIANTVARACEVPSLPLGSKAEFRVYAAPTSATPASEAARRRSSSSVASGKPSRIANSR
jgi:hypothetical protein